MQYNFRLIGSAFIFTILICTGIYFYTEWDLKRFVKELGEVPTFNLHPNIPSDKALHIPEHSWHTDLSVTTIETEDFQDNSITSETSETITERSASDPKTDPHRSEALILYQSNSLEEVSSELIELYEVKEIEEGFNDYNAFLTTNPEYAYERLADALREQYGDYPEIDIIVENVRRANNGTLTIDDAIAMREANLRITPPDATIEIQTLSDNIALLYDIKALIAEGEPVEIEFNISFGE